LIPHEKLN